MKIPSLIIALVAAVVFAAQLSTPILAETLVLNNATAPPLTNDDKTGFIDIVVGEAFRRVGLELSLITFPAERSPRNAAPQPRVWRKSVYLCDRRIITK